jgi:hypothetical protein
MDPSPKASSFFGHVGQKFRPALSQLIFIAPFKIFGGSVEVHEMQLDQEFTIFLGTSQLGSSPAGGNDPQSFLMMLAKTLKSHIFYTQKYGICFDSRASAEFFLLAGPGKRVC